MEGAGSVLIGFIGCGSIAAIALFVSKILGGKSDVKKIIHNTTQKLKQNNIINNEEKIQLVESKIEKNIALSKETQIKIQEVKQEANKEISKILNQEFSELNKEEDELW